MKTVRSIIIDDEELARDLIRNFLSGRPGIEVVAECGNGFEGVKAINDLKPDLVFLDILMPKLSGFEMLELIDEMPQVIFTTAHDEHAIKAFEMNAVDYLLKPFSKERLLNAVEKAVQKIQSGHHGQGNVEKLLNHPMTAFLERIVVKSGTKIKVIPVSRILYLQAEDDYVMIYTDEGKSLKKGTMKYFEDNLDPSLFVRAHRSYLVRIDQVTAIEPFSRENYIMKLKNGSTIRISRSGLKNIKNRLNF
jgi:two-component system, LytTR family, response regulator